MKCYFVASSNKFLERYSIYKFIVDTIQSYGGEITYDWIDEAKENILKNRDENRVQWYELMSKAIDDASIIIAEGSVNSYSVPHQITLAISKAKPVLLLRKSGKDSITGIHSQWLTQKEYSNKKDIENQISSFFQKYKESGRHKRFNLVLSLEEDRFLEKEMKKRGVSKTQVIRGLITKAITKETKNEIINM